jgi:hypothetical protein
MRRFIISIFYLGLFIHAKVLHASFDTKKGARPLGMGGAFVGAANSGDAFYYNPAGLWLINNPHTTAFYSVPFNIADLTTSAFNFTYPGRFGNATVNFESYGFDLYRETTLGFAYSRSFAKKLICGIVLNYDHLAIKNGGSAGTVGADVGFLFKPHEKVTIGFSSRNINGPQLARDKLPQVFTLGASWQALAHLTVNSDVYKDVKFPADIRVGAEYVIFGKLFLRAGMASEPSRFSVGMGFDFGAGCIDYAFYTHPDLGVTHAVSLSFHLHRKPLREIQH